MNKISSFIKNQAVLVAAWTLAIISAFIIPPGRHYFFYIDWRSLGILWSLMVIMMAFRLNGIFEAIGSWLLKEVHGITSLIAVLIFLCFFLSMLVTNDVALITFVPFSILILKACNAPHLLIPVIVLQTIAANLGSMLTPIGNPQNLYLFYLCNMELPEFILLMLPFTAISFVLLVISIIGLGKNGRTAELTQAQAALNARDKKEPDSKTVIVAAILFAVAILTVLHFVKWPVLVIMVSVAFLFLEPQAIKKADYSLLFTFIGFFIFTGNIARIPVINNQLETLVSGRELLVGIAASQVISNVPAALLLSDFSTHLDQLIRGVNLGGLGTLIASMASLISFKFYAALPEAKTSRYLVVFTALNILYLAVLLVFTLIF